MSKEQQDQIGERFGRWTVLGIAPPLYARRDPAWECRCDCGVVRVVSGYSLRRGLSKSCGCLKAEVSSRRSFKHGMSHTLLHNRWWRMIQRCHDPKYERYPLYGGRGIYVCDRWRKSFLNFLADMGQPPTPKHEIDRIDNDGPYSPENCRWATRTEQMRNTRSNRRIEFNGEVLTLSEWGGRLGIDPDTIGMRLKRGWSVEKSLTTPLIPTGKWSRCNA